LFRECQSVMIEDDSHKNLLKEMGKNIVNFSSNFFKMGKLIGLEGSKDFIKPEHGYGFKVLQLKFFSKIFFILWFLQIDGDIK